MTSQVAAVDVGLRSSPRTVRFDSALLLSGSMVVSGVLVYAFQILAARSLGAQEFGQVAVLWGAVFLVAIVLFRPLEQTLSRSIAHRLAQGAEVGSVLRSIGLITTGIAVATAVAASCGRRSLIDCSTATAS